MCGHLLSPASAGLFPPQHHHGAPLGLAVQVEEPTLRQRTILKGDKVADLPVQQAAERSGRTNLPYREHDMLVWSPTKHDVRPSRVVRRYRIAIQHFRNTWPTNHYVRTRLHPLLARRRLAREGVIIAGV